MFWRCAWSICCCCYMHVIVCVYICICIFLQHLLCSSELLTFEWNTKSETNAVKRRGATTTTITALTKLLLHMHLYIICMFVCVDGKNSAEIFHCKVTQAARGRALRQSVTYGQVYVYMYVCMYHSTYVNMYLFVCGSASTTSWTDWRAWMRRRHGMLSACHSPKQQHNNKTNTYSHTYRYKSTHTHTHTEKCLQAHTNTDKHLYTQ